ncbi:MAG: hypothetical protein HQL48_05710 [Gammaproteobacteria bacterium]|nr:hypothetical protein [Gammaproteobacteria bacterium]
MAETVCVVTMNKREEEQRSDAVNSLTVARCVEAICNCGCNAVRATITALEEGHEVSQSAALTPQELQMLLNELKAVMAVYDER